MVKWYYQIENRRKHMNVNGFELTDTINELCTRDRNKLLQEINNNNLDSCTRLVRLASGKEEVLQVCVMWDLKEIDLYFDDLKVYLFDEDIKKSELQRL